MRLVAVTAAVLAFSVPAHAEIMVLTAQDSGSYSNTGFHQGTNQNYLVGRTTGVVRNNFFVFDISSIVPGTVTSAVLRLFNPPNAFRSSDATETFTLFDVSTPISELVAGGSDRTNIFADLGSGVAFGSYNASTLDNNSVIEIPLNAAALQRLNQGGTLLAFGGAITSLQPVPPFPASEDLFAFTNALGEPIRQLVISPVPAPPGVLLAAMSVLALAAARGCRRLLARRIRA